MKAARRRIDVNLEELDRVLDGARQTPLSEEDHHKLRDALYALAAMLLRSSPHGMSWFGRRHRARWSISTGSHGQVFVRGWNDDTGMRVLMLKRDPSDEHAGVFTSRVVSIREGRRIATCLREPPRGVEAAKSRTAAPDSDVRRLVAQCSEVARRPPMRS